MGVLKVFGARGGGRGGVQGNEGKVQRGEE